jgi:hypothetical protein
MFGFYSQTIGHVNSGYEIAQPSVMVNRWKDFYRMLAQYRLLEDTYGKLDEAGKKDYEVFKLLSEVFVYEELQQMVDLWGDVPFSQAGTLAITGDATASKPKFDKAEDIYSTMLDRLGEINTRLQQLRDEGLTPIASAYLPQQDYICGGDLSLWQRFANSLRLRIAMRAASNGTIQQKAKDVLRYVLENPSTNPVIENNDQNILIKADNDGFNSQLDEGGSHGILDAYMQNGGRASWTVANMLTTTNDPRLPVMLTPNSAGEYRGMKYDENSTQQEEDIRARRYAVIDSATFGWNDNFPGILFTAAEVSFIKAEALKSDIVSGGSAEDAFKQAVVQSIDFYFYLNHLSTYRTPVDAPTEADKNTFAASRWNSDNDKNKVIAEQKWLHFSLFEQREAWAEVRRTGLPSLTFQTITASNEFSVPPSRCMYPENEYLNNKENYPSDASRNGEEYQRHIFWAKDGDYFTKMNQVNN